MGQETENIEARLAAYIDGLLTPEQRAEIERHLANNPEHRGVVADLLRQRDFLRALPRESAPADLSESLQGHLERSALLGDEHERPILSIRRFPQLTAVAA